MASTGKAGVGIPRGVASATGRAAKGRGLASAESVWGSQPISFDGYWLDDQGDHPDQQGSHHGRRRQPGSPQFTPLVGRSAAAYPALVSTSQGEASSAVFLTDLLHGVGVYEFNLRLFAGTYAVQGSVINRYS